MDCWRVGALGKDWRVNQSDRSRLEGTEPYNFFQELLWREKVEPCIIMVV